MDAETGVARSGRGAKTGHGGGKATPPSSVQDADHRAAATTASDRRAKGKALRQAVPRSSQAGWSAPQDRRDPVAILAESNVSRMASLIPVRFGRMMQSPFSFYRGAAAIMAADLATTPHSGPRVQACGDAHLLNFGGFATPERRVVFDINDLDETLPAPWEWDVKRLAASVVVAGRYLRLGEAESARAAEATVRTYRRRMADYAEMPALEVWYDTVSITDVAKALEGRAPVRALVEKAAKRSSPAFVFPKLVEQYGRGPRLKDDPPLIFHPTEEQLPGMTTGFHAALARYRASLPDHVRVLLDRYRFCDAAMKVVGVGSVGMMCIVGLFVAGADDSLFLQVKEARSSVLEPYAGKSTYENDGHRVVHGQHLMQSASDIFLGWVRGENGRDFYVRQLRDTKISPVIEDWDGDTLREYGKLCGWVLAKAHARSGDAAMIAGYMGGSSAFDEVIREFAVGYADQNERDYQAFVDAVRRGHLPAAAQG